MPPNRSAPRPPGPAGDSNPVNASHCSTHGPYSGPICPGCVVTLPAATLAVTVRHPWAWLIAHGHKPVENRTWKTAHRGPLAIHQGFAEDPAAHDHRHVGRALSGNSVITTPGCVVAVATLADCHRDTGCCRPWGTAEAWHWVLGDVVRLTRPVPATGRRGLWRVDLTGRDPNPLSTPVSCFSTSSEKRS